MNALLIAGILLRLTVFLTCSPFNPDDHAKVILYIAQNHSLPYSNQMLDGEPMVQSYHPPLYHLLMGILYAAWPSWTPIHFISFLLSALNLLLIRRLLDHPLIFPYRAGRAIVFGLACFLPEFVMFSGFISNDALTFPIGTVLFMAVLNYLQNPTGRRLAFVGLMIGLGLLTKGTFLLVGPTVALLVLLVESRRGWRSAIRTTVVFCLLWSLLGCYKYVENYIYWDRPIVHNLEVSPAYEMQRGTWQGLQSLYDINVIKLIRHPILQTQNISSIPMLFYATFWYPHIPSSSYQASWHGYQWVGSVIYALAIVPTLVFLAGFARGGWMSIQALTLPSDQRIKWPRHMLVAASMLMLLSNLAAVIAAGVKFDVWSCFQSRLCFQFMMPAIVFFGLGMEVLPGSRWLRHVIHAFCWAVVTACALYFVVEIAVYFGLLQSGQALQP